MREDEKSVPRKKRKKGNDMNRILMIALGLLALLLIILIMIFLFKGPLSKCNGCAGKETSNVHDVKDGLTTKPDSSSDPSKDAQVTEDATEQVTVVVTQPEETQTEVTSTNAPQEQDNTPDDNLPQKTFGTWDLSTLDTKMVPYGNDQNDVVCDGIPQGVFYYEHLFGQYKVDFISDYADKMYAGEETEPIIYLTMDCGFDNEHTGPILDILKEKGVKATFFVTSMFYDARPDLIDRMIKEGHRIGSHTINHYDMTTLSVEKQEEEVMDVVNKLKKDFDYDCRLFRFPTGNFSEETLALVENLGLKSVFWSYAYNDYSDTQPEVGPSLEAAASHVHTGAIYLLHASSSTNRAFLGDWIDQVRAKGYEFGGVYPVD